MRNALLILVTAVGCSAAANSSEIGAWQGSDPQRTTYEFRTGNVVMVQSAVAGRSTYSYRFADAHTLEFSNADGSRQLTWTNVRIGKSAMKYIVAGEAEERTLKKL
jgi:hypothetical protein